jgi:hypothetical protein
MTYKTCTCNPLPVVSSIVGDRCHIDNSRGEWCAIVNENGIYLQALIAPSSDELAKEQAHQEKIQVERVLELAKETRRQELKNKLNSGETLSLEELTELLRLVT